FAPSPDRWLGRPREHEFVAAMAVADPNRLGPEPSGPVEGDDLLRGGDLEGETTEPVDPIVHPGHAPTALVVGVAAQRIPEASQVGQQSPPREEGDEQAQLQRATEAPAVVGPLDEAPGPRPPALVAVDGDEQPPPGAH